MPRAYYNEFEPFAAQWLKNLITEGLIPEGDVDSRDIREVTPSDVRGYTQVHFFAGIGGWAYAARLSGWADTRPIWTGSPPCQPFSSAGAQRGQEDERHLWPVVSKLVDACRPPVFMGEQVEAAIGHGWLDGVFSDLEGQGYSCGSVIVPACSVDAPHRRNRLWFVAHSNSNSEPSQPSNGEVVGQCSQPSRHVGHPNSIRLEGGTYESLETKGREVQGRQARLPNRSRWGTEFTQGWDGKARRVEPSIPLLAHGVPQRMAKLRAFGNAIVPQVAAEIISSYMETYDPHHPS